MNINKSIILFLTIGMLAGCGDDDTTAISESEDSIQSKEFDNITSYAWDPYNLPVSNFVTVSKSTRSENILYTNYKYPGEGTFFIVSNSEEFRSVKYPKYENVYLSLDGLYKQGATRYPLGYKEYYINSVSSDGNTLNKTPHNLKGLKGLKIEEKGHWVDLSGMTVSDRTAVYWNTLDSYQEGGIILLSLISETWEKFHEFLALSKVTKFPAGAKCFKSESTHYTQPFYDVTLGLPIAEESRAIDVDGNPIPTIPVEWVEGVWGGIQWKYDKNYDAPTSGTAHLYAYINNEWRYGVWTKNPDISLDQLLKASQERLNELSGEEESSVTARIYANARYQELMNECTYYNDIAANTIDSLISKSIAN